MENVRRQFNSSAKLSGETCLVQDGAKDPAALHDAGVDQADVSSDHAEDRSKWAARGAHGTLVWGRDAAQETEKHILEHLKRVDEFCGTGAVAVSHLAGLLAGTRYGHVSEQCRLRLEDVQHVTKAEIAQVATEITVTLDKVGQRVDESTVSDEDIKLVATAFTRLMQLHCQFFLTASDVLAPLSKYVNDGQLPMSPSSIHNVTEASQSDSAAGQLNQARLCQENQSQITPGNQSASNNHSNVNEQDSSPKSSKADVSRQSDQMVHMVAGGGCGSPSGLRKISSFFSKLTRSGSLGSEGPTSIPQSSFYVTIPKEELIASATATTHDDKENQHECREQSGGVDGERQMGVVPSPALCKSDSMAGPHEGIVLTTGNGGSMKELKIPLNSTDISQVLPGLTPNGRLATQEELDSVIDLLSGGQRSPMQVIPENIPSHHMTANKPPPPVPLPPQPMPIGPQHHVMLHHRQQHPLFAVLPQHDGQPAPPRGITIDTGGLYMRNQQHGRHNQMHQRRSDGALAENLMRDQKTNTWPYRLHGRSTAGEHGPPIGSLSHHTLPSGNSVGSGCYDGLADVDYARYLATVKAMKSGSGPGLGAPLGGQGPWATGDGGLHRSWPMHLFNHEGAENVARNWSTVGDSSSCSDESSTGDTPWMMGLDLVGAVTDKRRHSSGEESFPSVPSCGHMVEMRPRSVENLLESKSTNTWPPKQPWAKLSGRDSDEVLERNAGDMPHRQPHPPLVMQWSDPLTNRSLSAWEGSRCNNQLL